MALRRTLFAVPLAVAAIALAPSGAAAAEGCDKVASPGPDAAQDLVDSLAPGQAGCLHAGRYDEDVTFNRGGSGDEARVTLRSFPGERATIKGRFYVPDRANFVTVENLALNAVNDDALPSPTVNGDDVIFQDNDVYDEHTTICFGVGNPGWGIANRLTIRRNRIHDCGVLPANNHDHGIYLTGSRDARILDNVIYDNADRGIQLYPDADGTVIRGNIVDGNGEGIIFSGAGGETSDDNVVENNIFSNAKIRFNIESWWPEERGTGNVARNNCVWGGARGNIAPQDGFTATRNLVADPKYVNRGAKDFRLAADSPCADVLAGGEAPAEPGTPAPTAGGDSGSGSGDTASDEPAGKPGEVVLENVSLKRGKGSRRWRLRVAGRLSGWGAEELRIQIRRGSGWQTIRTVRDVRKIFRVTVRPPLARLRKSNRLAVRVVVPGVDASKTVLARVR